MSMSIRVAQSLAVVSLPRGTSDAQHEARLVRLADRALDYRSLISDWDELPHLRRVSLGALICVNEAGRRCGSAGCLDCGGRIRQAAVLAMGTVDAVRYGHLRVTFPTSVHPVEFPGGLSVTDALGDVRRFLRTCTRTDRPAPFRAAVVVVEVEPSKSGDVTFPGCVCTALSRDQYLSAVQRWGGCAVCKGTRRSPLGHVHAHVVVAHDGPVWYGHGPAAVERPALDVAGWWWTEKGLLGRARSAGLGHCRIQPVRGGAGGAAAYLRKIAAYDGKVSDGKKRTEGERRWFALWSAWYLGAGVRRVSTHGEAYGRRLQWMGVNAPEVADLPQPLRVYRFSARNASKVLRRDNRSISILSFQGKEGSFLETPAQLVGHTDGTIVPTVCQLPPDRVAVLGGLGGLSPQRGAGGGSPPNGGQGGGSPPSGGRGGWAPCAGLRADL